MDRRNAVRDAGRLVSTRWASGVAHFVHAQLSRGSCDGEPRTLRDLRTRPGAALLAGPPSPAEEPLCCLKHSSAWRRFPLEC